MATYPGPLKKQAQTRTHHQVTVNSNAEMVISLNALLQLVYSRYLIGSGVRHRYPTTDIAWKRLNVALAKCQTKAQSGRSRVAGPPSSARPSPKSAFRPHMAGVCGLFRVSPAPSVPSGRNKPLRGGGGNNRLASTRLASAIKLNNCALCSWPSRDSAPCDSGADSTPRGMAARRSPGAAPWNVPRLGPPCAPARREACAPRCASWQYQ